MLAGVTRKAMAAARASVQSEMVAEQARATEALHGRYMAVT